jgi:hypothetical protein
MLMRRDRRTQTLALIFVLHLVPGLWGKALSNCEPEFLWFKIEIVPISHTIETLQVKP